MRTATHAIIGLTLIAETVGGLRWTPPAGWKSGGTVPMHAATYKVPPASGDQESAEYVVYFFGAGQGGSVQANVERSVHGLGRETSHTPHPEANGSRTASDDHRRDRPIFRYWRPDGGQKGVEAGYRRAAASAASRVSRQWSSATSPGWAGRERRPRARSLRITGAYPLPKTLG
jgi:hypothetical protein